MIPMGLLIPHEKNCSSVGKTTGCGCKAKQSPSEEETLLPNGSPGLPQEGESQLVVQQLCRQVVSTLHSAALLDQGWGGMVELGPSALWSAPRK